MPVQAAMFPMDLPLKVVCWDDLEEAIEYHATMLGEYPLITAASEHSVGPGGAVFLVKPDKSRWTFLFFRYNTNTEKLLACAFAEGQKWMLAGPPDSEKLEI